MTVQGARAAAQEKLARKAAREKLARELAQKYERDETASIRSLAEEIGRSYGFVHLLLTEQRVRLRARGGAARRKRN